MQTYHSSRHSVWCLGCVCNERVDLKVVCVSSVSAPACIIYLGGSDVQQQLMSSANTCYRVYYWPF